MLLVGIELIATLRYHKKPWFYWGLFQPWLVVSSRFGMHDLTMVSLGITNWDSKQRLNNCLYLAQLAVTSKFGPVVLFQVMLPSCQSIKCRAEGNTSCVLLLYSWWCPSRQRCLGWYWGNRSRRKKPRFFTQSNKLGLSGRVPEI